MENSWNDPDKYISIRGEPTSQENPAKLNKLIHRTNKMLLAGNETLDPIHSWSMFGNFSVPEPRKIGDSISQQPRMLLEDTTWDPTVTRWPWAGRTRRWWVPSLVPRMPKMHQGSRASGCCLPGDPPSPVKRGRNLPLLEETCCQLVVYPTDRLGSVPDGAGLVQSTVDL